MSKMHETIQSISERHEKQHSLYLSGLTLDAGQAHKDRGSLISALTEGEMVMVPIITLKNAASKMRLHAKLEKACARPEGAGNAAIWIRHAEALEAFLPGVPAK